MNIKPIRTEKDYNLALQRLEIIFDAEFGTSKGDELEILSLLIDKYEKDHFPIDLPNPIEAIKFRMEQLGIKIKDLSKILGLESPIELSQRNKLSLPLIRKFYKHLNIPPQILIKEY